jgi:ACS family hexuronate transporter-like MFS transporter
MKIRNLRWHIVGLLTLVTVINYLDRNALAVAQVQIKDDLGISKAEYGRIVSTFLIAYGLFHPIMGRLIDRLGSRAGLILAFLWWSAASIGHAFATGFRSFAALRFGLGIGESGNLPAAVKTIGEWFPARERALATGILNVGTGVGAMLAPPLVGGVMKYLGWRWAFILTGGFGLVWLVPWLILGRRPERHPYITDEELDHIRSGQAEAPVEAVAESGEGVWGEALRTRELWVLMLARLLSDPVWLFFSAWLPLYFKDARNLDINGIMLAVLLPFLASGFGSVFGGWLSSFLIGRGWSVLGARKAALCFSAALMPVTILSVHVGSWQMAVACISIAAFGHQSWSASTLTLPADLFPKRMVASCYGITGMAGVLGGAATQWYVGGLIERVGYTSVFTISGCMHPIGALAVLLLVRAVYTTPGRVAAVPPPLPAADRVETAARR